MKERGHLLQVLKQTRKALQEKDNVELKILSNKILHTASIEQDPDMISVTVIIYSLSKLIEREEYKKYKNWNNFYKKCTKGIDNAIKYLEKNDFGLFRKEIDLIGKLINKLSGKLKSDIQDVFRKAKINKASKIYEHGISMSKTAKILGVSVWELTEYAGKTGIGGVNLAVTMPIKKRLQIAEEAFK